VLLTVTALGTYLAYEYTIFPSAPTTPARQMIIDLEEMPALAALFCVGLLLLSWRLARAQRLEMARRIAAEHQAREAAHQDSLTGMPNRRQFDSELKAAIAAPPRSGGTHAVLLLDLKDFKRINDRYGHAPATRYSSVSRHA